MERVAPDASCRCLTDVPDAVFGPNGALIGAVVLLGLAGRAILAMWKEFLKAAKDDRDQRDIAQDLLRQSLKNNADSILAWNRRTEQEASRQRRTDKS